MTPELETCLNYLDHGEGGGAPYLPTLRGMIVNAVAAELASLRASLAAMTEAKEKAEGERDEARTALCRAREALDRISDIDKSPVYGEVHILRTMARNALLSSSAPCPDKARVRQLEEAVRDELGAPCKVGCTDHRVCALLSDRRAGGGR